jgi:hypothetical protein
MNGSAEVPAGMDYFVLGDEELNYGVNTPEDGVEDVLKKSLPLDELARDSQAGGARRRRCRQSRKSKGKGRRSTRRPKRLQRRHRH